MSTSRPGKQKLIEVCYCSPNLKQDRCDYCMAKHEVSRLLDAYVPEFLDNEDAKQREIDETFTYYSVSPKGRLEIIFKLEDEEFKKL